MAFTHRMVTLAAVVAIPLGIAATSYALTDAPGTPEVPPAVELDATPRPAPPPSADPTGNPSGTPSGPSGVPTTPAPTGDAVVPGPAATDDDDSNDDADDAGEEN
ncbi:small hydrophilic protein [Streptomyces zhihengii]|uniref:Small hydrophilic protein n=1 Tax=Streptomyces zhihengii TaxID=1818004 RepID=A0ABS2UX22_9ACTN|nr:small hydrophilic protein [Streptomyces zhihengii]MBM9622044.1 small hydrophilic protein [Streptomyces zhihengii]